MKVLVYSKYSADLARFSGLLSHALPDIEFSFAHTLDEASPHLSCAEVIYGWGFPIQLAQSMPKLRWIQKMGAGVDDITGSLWPFAKSVVLTRTDGKLIAPRMVEYVISAILNHTQKRVKTTAFREKRTWEYVEIDSVRGHKIGVAGLGEIGLEIAVALRRLGANVVGWKRSFSTTDAVTTVYRGKAGFKPFLESIDTLVLVLPKTVETTRIINNETLRFLPAGAHIVNVGRGDLIDEDALLENLDNGHIAHASLDVTAKEPLPPTHPFWTHASVTLTPHISGPLIPEDVVQHFIYNARAFATGGAMLNVVDPERQY